MHKAGVALTLSRETVREILRDGFDISWAGRGPNARGSKLSLAIPGAGFPCKASAADRLPDAQLLEP